MNKETIIVMVISASVTLFLLTKFVNPILEVHNKPNDPISYFLIIGIAAIACCLLIAIMFIDRVKPQLETEK